ncbi:cytochrome P450 [Mycena crocata]|nr:cytochrome P450 [Mycena crocata]
MSNSIAIVLLASLTCHLIFKRYEPTSLIPLSFLLVISPATLAFLHGRSLLFSYLLYYTGLLLSIITYRICPAHSLSRYPGPLACKISKIWLAYIAYHGKLHLYVKHLHDKYGPVVRIGPNELSIVDSSAIQSILGAKGMPKGPMWDGRQIPGPKNSGPKTVHRVLIATRDLERHAESRKVWSTAFTPAAVKGYEIMLVRRVTQLVEALRAQKGPSVDISLWCSFFSFDFMGDMAFGGGFELMRDEETRGFWYILERGLWFPSLTQHIPWSDRLAPYLPMVGKDRRALARLATEQSKRRLQEGSVHNDLFYYLMENKRTESEPTPLLLVVSNGLLAITAGSDTAASVLSNIFFYLMAHPESYKRLQAEMEKYFPRGPGTQEPNDAVLLSNMSFLNAVIKETLRLQPPVPTSLQRAPTIGGGSRLIGADIVLPEGAAVLIPPYTMHRDPRYFSPDPDSFRPERWLDEIEDPTFILNQDAFIPFSAGPANCIGRNLAMLEMRMVLAHVLRAFDICFEPGYDKYRWEAELKDYFVLHKGSLPVVLKAR